MTGIRTLAIGVGILLQLGVPRDGQRLELIVGEERVRTVRPFPVLVT